MCLSKCIVDKEAFDMLTEKRVVLNEVDMLKYVGMDFIDDEYVKDPSSSTGFSYQLNGFGCDLKPDELVTPDEFVKRVIWVLVTENVIEDVSWTGEFIPRASIVPKDKRSDDIEYLWKLVLTVSA